MPRAYIAVGSNLDPQRHIPAALRRLAGCARLVAISTFYLSPALGRPEQPDFYNGAVEIETELPPRELKFSVLRAIEAAQGRRRRADRYAAREIDLDLALYDEEVDSGSWLVGRRVVHDPPSTTHEPDLVLPDPEIAARPFLALPLAELAPDLILPGGRSLREVAAGLDASDLRPLPGFTARLRKELLHES